MTLFDSREFYRQVGLLLGMRRRERVRTQEEVARAIGIPRATYASIEGGRQRITVDILWRAAAVLACPLSALVPESVAPRAVASKESTPIYRCACGVRARHLYENVWYCCAHVPRPCVEDTHRPWDNDVISVPTDRTTNYDFQAVGASPLPHQRNPE